ncbi:MAG: AI-2E family transporter, partial [Pseudomonadota bacterium]
TLEGQFITPAIVGQRLRMNAVAIFVGVAFWGWMWGIVGMLIAVPMMVALKIVADNTPGLGGLAEFLSGRHEPDEEPGEAPASA